MHHFVRISKIIEFCKLILTVFFTVITALDSKISDMNYMFKVFFQTGGLVVQNICRILGKHNNVIKVIVLIISTVMLEGYLSIYIL